LNKEFRQFLLLDGSKDWVMLDVRTSQAYFALAILKDYEKEVGWQSLTDEWARAVCDSDLYETLAAKLGMTREQAKAEWFKILFSKNYPTPQKDAFAELFPCVAAIFEHEKRRDFRRLAVKLQVLESYAIVECRIGIGDSEYCCVGAARRHSSFGVRCSARPEDYPVHFRGDTRTRTVDAAFK
jgi:hypothetical protein